MGKGGKEVLRRVYSSKGGVSEDGRTEVEENREGGRRRSVSFRWVEMGTTRRKRVSTRRERGEADWGVEEEKVRSSPTALTGHGKEEKTDDAKLLPSICAARRQAGGTTVPTGTGPFPPRFPQLATPFTG
ncbi:hypothetical protein MTO96_032353 [Rhipicephalus appendiculatus]